MFTLARNKTLSARPSSDALSQHPLLGSTPSSNPIDTTDSTTTGSSTPPAVSSVALPYKPRQRHGGGPGSGGSAVGSVPPPIGSAPSGNIPTLNVTSASSASAVVQPSTVSANPSSGTVSGISSSSSSTGGSVTARLQLQSLKAAGQRMGLSNGSVGMQMLDGLFEKGQISRSGSGGDWGDVLKVLTAGKATLLLPSSPSSSLPMTPQTLRDHIIFTSSTGGQDEMFVTFSGMMGKIISGRITIESCFATDSVMMGLLRDPSTRSSALNNLQPLYPTSAENKPPFPSYAISNRDSTLPFPPPPPPPNPSALSPSRSRSSSNASITGPQPPSSVSRLNPFASLWGSQSGSGKDQSIVGLSGKDLAMSPDRAGFPSLKGRPPSIHSVESHAEVKEMQDTEPFHIPGWVIDKVIKYGEVTKALSKAIRGRLDEELRSIPDKTVDKTFKFILSLHPMTSDSRNVLSDAQIADVDLARPDETSDAVQQFVETIYDELYAYYLAGLQVPESPSGLGSLRRRSSQNAKSRNASSPSTPTTPTLNDAEKDRAETKKKEKDKREMEDQAEKQATEAANSVESAICNALYNQLFSPPTADDARHDEALSSRIAALNLLELSLDHLGIQTRESADGGLKQDDIEMRNATVMGGLEDIVQAVGQELALLDGVNCHTAQQKTEHLIKAHKVITDGLSKLPPIRLRAEGEGHKTPERPSSPLTIDVALSGDDDSAEPSKDALAFVGNSIPPPLPPRRAPSTESVQSATRASSKPPSIDSLDTPLPDLLLPDAVATNAMEEAMSASILETRESNLVSSADISGTGAAATLSRVSSRASAHAPPVFDGGPSGADLLLPLVIYSIVKSNPKRLVSHVLYVQRYRSAICLSGEASYAIVNLTAVIEFLEHVDLAELGLTSAEKVMSVADLSPVGLTYYEDKNADAASIASASSRIRGRVNQVGELAGSAAGSANKVIAGVVDSGWSALRGLLAPNLALLPSEQADGLPNLVRPPPAARKGSAFSIHTVTASVASIAAAAASHRERPRANTMPTEREMTEVTSRPASIHGDIEELSEREDSGDEDELARRRASKHLGVNHEAQSRLRAASYGGKLENDKSDRMSISDRFANMTVLGKLGAGDKPLPSPSTESSNISSFFGNLGNRSTHARRSSLLTAPPGLAESAPMSEVSSLPISHLPSSAEDVAPPIERFMTCDVSDLRLAEVGELLRDYRRLARLVATNKSYET